MVCLAILRELEGELTSSEPLPPATVGVLVEVANQGVGNTRIVQVRADLSPVLGEIVVLHPWTVHAAPP